MPNIRGIGLVWWSWTTSAAPWAPYFSRAASHPLFQLASGDQFFRSAECLRLDRSYGCCSWHGGLNQPSAAARWGRGGRGGRKVMEHLPDLSLSLHARTSEAQSIHCGTRCLSAQKNFYNCVLISISLFTGNKDRRHMPHCLQEKRKGLKLLHLPPHNNIKAIW